MKTIKDAAKESSLKVTTVGYASFFNGFTSGVEFAQRWIPVEEEEPPRDKPFISKSANNDKFVSLSMWNDSISRFCPIVNGSIDPMIRIRNITHWRPIELK